MRYLAIILIIIAGIAVYTNSFKNEFVWDDEWIVGVNPQIRSFALLPKVFSTGLFQAYGVGEGSFYRPMQVLTYMVDYKLWQLRPFGYHLTNIALHILCALLLFAIVNTLVGDVRPAFIASLLFVVHPIHTQAVTYISGRADPLSVVFVLASLFCFIKNKRIASFAFFIFALLTKEAAAILPFFLALYLFSFKKMGTVPIRGLSPFSSIIPFFAVIGVYAILRQTALNFSEGSFLAATPLALRLLTACKNVFAYLGLLIAPVGLHMSRRVVFVESLLDFKVLSSLAGLALIGLWMFRMRKKSPVMFFFAGWFFIGIIPVSNIVPLNATLAEHWAYLPSMGLFALVGIGCARLGGPVVLFLVTACVIFYGFLTMERNKDWRNPLSIYTATKKYVPGNFRLRNNLGRLYFHKGMLDEAIGEYEASLLIQPLYAQAHSNLGVAYAAQGRHEEAIAEYKRALELDRRLLKTYRNMADAYMKIGREKEAREIYEKGRLESLR